MSASMFAVVIAIALAILGVILAHRSRMSHLWRALCPECRQFVWLPLRSCPLCGANFESGNNRVAIIMGRKEFTRGRRALLRRGQLFILLACGALLVAWLITFDPSLVAF
jgi:hypothetical protein